MDFQVSGDKLFATGEIVPGDAQRFAQTIARVPKSENGVSGLTIALESPGGDLFEGINLGLAIRTASLPSLVMRGKLCASACAIAFLGGKFQGAVSAAETRRLEPGARLAFHGYRLATDEIQIANETLDAVRVSNAIILEYASRMGSVDLGALAELLTVPPEKMEIIDTPREISALGILLVGQPLKAPKDWPMNACRAAVAEQLSVLDAIGAEDRLLGEAEPMANLEAFRRRLLDDKYHAADETAAAVRAAVMKLPAGDALDLLAGGALFLEQGKVGVWRVQLERGAGFYFDACYGIAKFDSGSISTILVSGVSPSMVVGHHNVLAGHPANTPLW